MIGNGAATLVRRVNFCIAVNLILVISDFRRRV